MSLLLNRPQVRAQLAATLRELDHPVPWTASEGRPGTLLDANGLEVGVVDKDSLRTDEEAHRLAGLIAIAVNACASEAP
jgi:hypothetical protein